MLSLDFQLQKPLKSKENMLYIKGRVNDLIQESLKS